VNFTLDSKKKKKKEKKKKKRLPKAHTDKNSGKTGSCPPAAGLNCV